MKVKCYNCGLVREAAMGESACPECGFHRWYSLPEKKIDKESLEIMLETYNMAKNWLTEKGYMTFRKIPEDPFKYRIGKKKEGLAFEIIDIKDGNKIRVRKIYLNGHIEGFEGNPCIVNHMLPKINALKYFAQSMNEEYRKFIIRCVASDFYPIENLNVLYEKFKETIEKL